MEKGLENRIGENNCFLNVVIQGLWHLQPFRNAFTDCPQHFHLKTPRETPRQRESKQLLGKKEQDNHYADFIAHAHGESICIFCGLGVIFSQFQYGDHPNVTPVALRSALSTLFRSQSKFQLGKLDDAAEALDAVLSSLHQSVKTSNSKDESCEPPCFVHQLFSLTTLEQRLCKLKSCGASSEPVTSNSFIYYVYTSALGNIATAKEPFDKLLRRLCEEDARPCTNSKYCTGMNHTNQYLLSQPKIFTVGLAWEEEAPSVSNIKSVLQLIDQKIQMSAIFHHTAEKHPYTLKGMICYYGKHYDAYFINESDKRWWVFDDTTVKGISDNWNDVMLRCLAGRYQPAILFYEREDATVAPLEDGLSSLQVESPTKPSSMPVTQLSQLKSSNGQLETQIEEEGSSTDNKNFLFQDETISTPHEQVKDLISFDSPSLGRTSQISNVRSSTVLGTRDSKAIGIDATRLGLGTRSTSTGIQTSTSSRKSTLIDKNEVWGAIPSKLVPPVETETVYQPMPSKSTHGTSFNIQAAPIRKYVPPDFSQIGSTSNDSSTFGNINNMPGYSSSAVPEHIQKYFDRITADQSLTSHSNATNKRTTTSYLPSSTTHWSGNSTHTSTGPFSYNHSYLHSSSTTNGNDNETEIRKLTLQSRTQSSPQLRPKNEGIVVSGPSKIYPAAVERSSSSKNTFLPPERYSQLKDHLRISTSTSKSNTTQDRPPWRA